MWNPIDKTLQPSRCLRGFPLHLGLIFWETITTWDLWQIKSPNPAWGYALKSRLLPKLLNENLCKLMALNIHLISLLAMTGNTSFFFCPTHVCHFITALSVQSWMKVNINVQRMNKSYLQIHAMSQSNGQRKHKINTVNGSKSSFYFPQSICEVYMMRQMCLGRKCGRKDVLLNVWINSFNAAAELP